MPGHQEVFIVSSSSVRILSNVLFLIAGLSLVIPVTGYWLDDPSLPSQLFVGDLPEGLPHANEGAFESLDGVSADPGENLNTANLGGGGGFDLPTGGKPSPLFGAQPFTQQMLRFEEFGRLPLPASYVSGTPLPGVPNAQSCPDGLGLDAYISQELYPAPTRMSNTADMNPWKSQIDSFLGRVTDTPPMEGRPGGEGWAHQRWDEFPPEVYFQSAQTGARPNLGLRDTWQLHGWASGEFAAGGLYWNSTGNLGYEGKNEGISIRFHPNMPEQDPLALWTFDGTLPPKLLMARYGEPILFRHHNALPIDPSANMGFGLHTISTHEHNGHNPAESDGYANAFFFPGQYYDYRWPMVLRGARLHQQAFARDPMAGDPGRRVAERSSASPATTGRR